MTYETGIIIGGVGISFFFAYVAFNWIRTTTQNKGLTEAVSIFLLMVSFLNILLTISIMQFTAETETPLIAGLVTAISQQYYLSIITIIVVFLFIVLLLFYAPVRAALRRRKFMMDEDG